MQYINLDFLRDYLSRPEVVARLDRVKEKGGWDLVLWARCRLAEEANADQPSDDTTDKLIVFRDEKLDRWGEPPDAYALRWLEDRFAFAELLKRPAMSAAVNDVLVRYYYRHDAGDPANV